MSVGRIFSTGVTSGFSKSFSTGAISEKVCFLPLETKKTALCADIFKFLHPFRNPCLCAGKIRAIPLKIGVKSSVLTPYQIVKLCWILYAKWNIWQVNFNCVFVFALATLNNSILFLHWQHQWHPYTTENLLVATYALSCLCIPVSNAVVEWVFSHVTSVFKMWKSCDFECV